MFGGVFAESLQLSADSADLGGVGAGAGVAGATTGLLLLLSSIGAGAAVAGALPLDSDNRFRSAGSRLAICR